MSRTFTRDEFYELVWSRPMTQLAREFALSDVALHKICRKHGIPNPPPGWWARKAAGKKVVRTPLPRTKGAPERIVIAGSELRREPDAVAAVREQARVLASTPAPELQMSPVIARTIARLRKGKTGPTGLVSTEDPHLIRCAVAPASIDRLAAALPAIITAAAQQGFRLEAKGDAPCLAGAEETIAFSISEGVKRVKHELTDREKAEEEKWQRRIERRRFTNEWDALFVPRPRHPEWDWHPTGQLSFELEQVYVWSGSSPRRSFRDAKIQRLETMASDIAVGVAVLAAAKKEQRLRREAEQRRAEEQCRLRNEALRAKHVEERRISALKGILDELDSVERLRRLLGALQDESREATGGRTCEFVRWAEDHLGQCASRLTGEALSERFENQRLFGEDDDHAFRPSHW